MVLQITRVETEIDVSGSAEASEQSPDTSRSRLHDDAIACDALLKERLRPVVLEILAEELERIRRQQG